MFHLSSIQRAFGALLTVGTVVAFAQDKSADEIKSHLIPLPHQLTVVGPSKAIASAPQVIRFYNAKSSAFDPLAPLANGPLAGKVTEADRAAKQPMWVAAIVGSAEVKLSDKTIASYAETAAKLPSESYILETAPQDGMIAVVIAGGPRGLLYGAQTLAQLAAVKDGELPSLRIEDSPDVSSRELHVHGFDKGYGAGDLKSLESFKRLMPSFMPTVAAARFNLFRLSIDAGWINEADRWCGSGVDDAMKSAIADAHRNGVDVLVEVRLQGQEPGANEIRLRPMNPITEWDRYESAVRRALSWGPDVIDFSCNDLGSLRFPEVKAKYGVEDGRFSGVLMAALLKKVQAIINHERPGTQLRHLPRFYGEVYWKRYPNVLDELFAHAPKGVAMYATSGLVHPLEAQMRQKYDASFVWWVNYSSNHAKEMRIILDAKPKEELAPAIGQLPFDQRKMLVNLGYPVEPQRTVALATGEWLWNVKAYDRRATLARAARQIWGDGPDATFMKYDDLLDYDTTLSSLGSRAADLIAPGKMTADEEAVTKRQPKLDRVAQLPQWKSFVSRAEQAADVAQQLQQQVKSDELKKVADQLYWNARRVQLDSKIGVLFATPEKTSDIDRAAVEALLIEHETILREHYPIEKNDPKSSEVVTRGIRRIREAMTKIQPAGK